MNLNYDCWKTIVKYASIETLIALKLCNKEMYELATKPYDVIKQKYIFNIRFSRCCSEYRLDLCNKRSQYIQLPYELCNLCRITQRKTIIYIIQCVEDMPISMKHMDDTGFVYAKNNNCLCYDIDACGLLALFYPYDYD
jgi:hypothetical protein